MLKGLVSFVTGGASGLGRETARHLAKQGGSVVIADLPASKGLEVAESLEGNVIFAPCDVSVEDEVAAALSLCKERYGRLDVAVNCAGMARAFKIANPLSQKCMNMEEIELVYKSNVYGTFNVTRLGAQLMAQNEPNEDNQRGVIIYTGSLSSSDGVVGQSAYAAAKGAISAMTLPVARDLSSIGIRAVTIAPSLFDTPLTSEICLTKVVRQYYIEQCLFPKRFGDPSEFARMVETVVSSPMLNGEVIKLTGGLRFHVDILTPISPPTHSSQSQS